MYLVCLLAWGLNFIAIKIQGHGVALELSLFYRLAGAFLVFVALTAWFKPAGRPQRQDWPFLSVFGLLNLALSYLLLYYATTWISAALVTLVFSLKTLGTPVALRIFLKQELRLSALVGGLIGICGVGLVLYPLLGQIQLGSALKGLTFAVLGMVLTSVGDASSARNSQRGIHPLWANTFGFGVATALLGGLNLWQGQHWQFDYSASYISALLYLTLVASCLAWLFYLKLIERIGAAASSYMVALFPAVGGLGSVLIGESEPTLYLLLGCLVSCVGAGIALGGVAALRRRVA